MSYYSQFGGSNPAKITTYNSGSGTFTPISNNQSWARITLVGGGGGGAGYSYDANNYEYNVASGGGGGGGTVQAWVKINSALGYSVGAGGGAGVAYVNYFSNNGGNGGNTSLGNIIAGGGAGGTWSYGGASGFYGRPGSGGGGTIMGGSGGGMQSGTQTWVNNYSTIYSNNAYYPINTPAYSQPGGGYNVGGGSLYGYNGSGAGAGGTSQTAGVAGLIYIEEFIQ